MPAFGKYLEGDHGCGGSSRASDEPSGGSGGSGGSKGPHTAARNSNQRRGCDQKKPKVSDPGADAMKSVGYWLTGETSIQVGSP